MPDIKHISDGVNTWDIPTPVKFAEIAISSSGTYPSTMGNDSQHIINVIQAYRNGDITINNIPSANLVSWIAAGYAVFVRILMSGFGGSGTHQTEYAILTSAGAGAPGYVWTPYGNGGMLYFFFNSTYTGFQGTNAVSGQLNRLCPEKIDNLEYPGMGDVMAEHSTLVNGDVLTWDAVADRWVAQQPGGGGGGGSADKVYYLFDANQPGTYQEGILTTTAVNQESQRMILCSDTAGQNVVTVGNLIDELSSNYSDIDTPKSIIIQTNTSPLHCSYVTSVCSVQGQSLYGDAVVFSMYVQGSGMMTFALGDYSGTVIALRIS